MNGYSGRGGSASALGRPEEWEPASPIVMPGQAEPTIYDVSPSTVSRALSKPGRVSYKTAEHVRQVAQQLGYRTGRMERTFSERGTGMLGIIVADIANPVFFGMIRGAERAGSDLSFTMLVVETQESGDAERAALDRLIPVVDGVILSSSRMSDSAIRSVAKRTPLVLLNRMVNEVASVVSDNAYAITKAAEHLVELGHTSICYLAGPEASWADGARWRGLKEVGVELDLQVRRLGPFLPTMRGGAAAVEQWMLRPSTAVIAYNDLMAIGFLQAVKAAGWLVPRDVSVIGFDNIVDSVLVEPHVTTIAAPLISLGSAAVWHLLQRSGRLPGQADEPVVLPARLVVRGSTGVRQHAS
ncbi:MAG: LacI family DNA-binding transcriptional regulator [Propionibacteriaceae bacterium]|jgi:DNA-binding LacI/PurR family transcriptional regulator